MRGTELLLGRTESTAGKLARRWRIMEAVLGFRFLFQNNWKSLKGFR